MGQSTIHDFRDQLIYSEQASDEPFWDAVYREAFPNLVSHMLASGDHVSQRMGIDRVILLSNGQMLKIDEKKRKEVYDDILLEYISVDTTRAPGWIEKDLAIDYLAYAFMPTKRVYLLPWINLRRTWQRFGKNWKKQYPTCPTRNKGYTTLSVAVPIRVLLAAIANASIVQL